MRMAKKLKEDINLDEIDENFIISSFKTGGKASATDTGKEKVTDVREVPQEQNQPEQPQAEEEPQTTVRTKENRETGKGKKRGLSEYGEKFLKRNELKTRQCVYISQQIHTVISRLVHVIADKDITVGGYIDTVLAEHLERHKDEINELYRQKREDLI
ncbi:DUF3408 domain-containing protein [Parabacteroides johnsonii]